MFHRTKTASNEAVINAEDITNKQKMSLLLISGVDKSCFLNK